MVASFLTARRGLLVLVALLCRNDVFAFMPAFLPRAATTMPRVVLSAEKDEVLPSVRMRRVKRKIITTEETAATETTKPVTSETVEAVKEDEPVAIAKEEEPVAAVEEKEPVAVVKEEEPVAAVKEEEPVAPAVETLKPRTQTAVTMKVQDVRDLVSGNGSSAPVSSKPADAPGAPTGEVSTKKESTKPTIFTTTSDDSLERMLADAREMRASDQWNGKESDSSDGGVSGTIRNAISTIVTADFFAVCGFLLWFLAGIFQSAVFKDDTIQIAFNSNFQQLVQPALGILMIGTLAGAVFKEEEEEDPY